MSRFVLISFSSMSGLDFFVRISVTDFFLVVFSGSDVFFVTTGSVRQESGVIGSKDYYFSNKRNPGFFHLLGLA